MTTALILLTSISAIASCISAFIACQKVSAFYKHIRQMQDIYLDNMDELYELRERDKICRSEQEVMGMYEYIPEELKQLKNWVCWKAIPAPRKDNPDHISKIPINPYTGGQAQSNNPETWSDFTTAVERSHQFSGVGFIFNGSGYSNLQ